MLKCLRMTCCGIMFHSLSEYWNYLDKGNRVSNSGNEPCIQHSQGGFNAKLRLHNFSLQGDMFADV